MVILPMEFIQFLVESARPQYREERKLYVQKERLQALKLPLRNFIELSFQHPQKRRNYIMLAKFRREATGRADDVPAQHDELVRAIGASLPPKAY